MKVYNVDDLTFFTTYTINLYDIDIPMICKIQDIKNGDGFERIPFFLDEENNVNYTKDKFKTAYMLLEKRRIELLYFQKFLDYENKIFFEDGEYYNFLEYYEFESLEDFFDLLDDVDKSKFVEQADKMIRFNIDEFTHRAKRHLGCDMKIPNIPKSNNPTDHIWESICEYLGKTKGYLETQLITEFSNNIQFKENIGKSFDNFSIREVQYKLLYLHKKETSDGCIESYKAWKQEQTMKSTKSNSDGGGVRTRKKRQK